MKHVGAWMGRTMGAAALMTAAAFTPACGGAQRGGTADLTALRAALAEPVTSLEVSQAHSRLAEAALEENAFEGKTRAEVEALLGRGDDCATHPRCAEQGFADDDWHYDVGVPAEHSAPIPVIILGFDRSGRVSRTWNLRTHD